MPAIGVRHDDICRQQFAIHQTHTARPTFVDQDLIRFDTKAHASPLAFDHADHRLGNRRNAANRIVNAKFLFGDD